MGRAIARGSTRLCICMDHLRLVIKVSLQNLAHFLFQARLDFVYLERRTGRVLKVQLERIAAESHGQPPAQILVVLSMIYGCESWLAVNVEVTGT